MASNIKVDIVRPTATNGSLSLKGDSGGSATANGITVDSSGNTTITGTFTSKGIDDNASSTALTIDASGNTTLGGNLVIPNSGTIGSASDTDSITIDSSGNVTLAEKLIIDPTKGIQFRTSTGGSGTTFGSGILDDYEEGTFTATITPATSGTATLGATDNELAYTKIGRLVVIQGRLQVSSVSSPVGSYFEVPIPFNSFSGTDESDISTSTGAIQDASASYSMTGGYAILINSSSSVLNFYVDCSIIEASDLIHIKASYIAA